MLGAIAGDIIGAPYEWNRIKTKEFPLFSPSSCFTDDTVLTVALADTILNRLEYGSVMREYYRRYPHCSYGAGFHIWANSPHPAPYNSWGNGAALRVSPVGCAFDDLNTVLKEAARFTSITHNHPEGIRGAQAVASAIYYARKGESKERIREFIESDFGYNINQTLEEIRPAYQFDESCQGTVPQAIICFIESTDFEDAIRNAVSLGGDSDTLACITGGIAQAFCGEVPGHIMAAVEERLDRNLWDICQEFSKRFGC